MEDRPLPAPTQFLIIVLVMIIELLTKVPPTTNQKTKKLRPLRSLAWNSVNVIKLVTLSKCILVDLTSTNYTVNEG